MTTFSILEDASVGASGVSGGVVASVKANILAAAELWNRYFTQAAFDIKIELKFADLSGSTLATGGSGLSFTGFGGAGLEVWKVDSTEEYITGGEVGGSAVDITITVDTPKLLAGDFFFDPDPFARTAAVPGGKNDFMSVMLHEIGHGLGFLSFSSEGMDTVDDSGTPDAPDVTQFDLWVDPDASGGRSFVGPAATALFGGDIILDPGSSSHIAKASDGGFENLMDPSLLVGSRSYIAPIHIAIFEDIGMPIRKPTGGADALFGFDLIDDSVSLFGGSDSFSGLTGDDTVNGGAGNDTLNGNEGADVLLGGTGFDSLVGGAGNDDASGAGGNDRINGGSGADTLNGGDGNDRINGDSGNDSLIGGVGFDTMRGGLGLDTLIGDGGNDNLFGGGGADDISGNAGADRLRSEAGNDTVRGGDGNDRIFGSFGFDSLNGGLDDDLLDGNGGNDTLVGSSGNDTLIGNFGFDSLNGGGGNDSLEGAGGNDTVTGGSGDDRFVFSDGDDNDLLTDFTAGAGGVDEIELSGFGAAFDTFGEVIGAASQAGSNVVIDFGGGDMLRIAGISVGDLVASDFVFS